MWPQWTLGALDTTLTVCIKQEDFNSSQRPNSTDYDCVKVKCDFKHSIVCVNTRDLYNVYQVSRVCYRVEPATVFFSAQAFYPLDHCWSDKMWAHMWFLFQSFRLFKIQVEISKKCCPILRFSFSKKSSVQRFIVLKMGKWISLCFWWLPGGALHRAEASCEPKSGPDRASGRKYLSER